MIEAQCSMENKALADSQKPIMSVPALSAEQEIGTKSSNSIQADSKSSDRASSPAPVTTTLVTTTTTSIDPYEDVSMHCRSPLRTIDRAR